MCALLDELALGEEENHICPRADVKAMRGEQDRGLWNPWSADVMTLKGTDSPGLAGKGFARRVKPRRLGREKQQARPRPEDRFLASRDSWREQFAATTCGQGRISNISADGS